MRSRLVVAIGLLIACCDASAQDCGGMVNVNGICIPPDQESSPLYDSYGGGNDYRAPPPPQPKWIDRWGGMAMDDDEGISGIVADLPSKRKAKKAAIAECESRGGKNCTIAAIYKNQCLVVVSNSSRSQIVNAATIGRATALAMRDCMADGSNDCHVFYSGCSNAIRIR